MKALLILSLLLSGCAVKLGGTKGLAINPPKPPAGSYVRITGRSIGLHLGQNPASQSPEIVLGYKSATYDRLPTSIGTNIFIPSVRATIGVGGSLTATVAEGLETGDAAKK